MFVLFLGVTVMYLSLKSQWTTLLIDRQLDGAKLDTQDITLGILHLLFYFTTITCYSILIPKQWTFIDLLFHFHTYCFVFTLKKKQSTQVADVEISIA